MERKHLYNRNLPYHTHYSGMSCIYKYIHVQFCELDVFVLDIGMLA